MITVSVKEQLFKNPDVTSVGWGFRYKRGKRTSEKCVVVGVKKKLLGRDVRPSRMIQSSVNGLATDVQDRDIKALAYIARMRPCPPGYSIGHVAITAGTLGAYVHAPGIDDWAILSNNHVLANSNQGKVNDEIIQPGKADGGHSGSDRFAWLRSFAIIKWDGGGNGGCNLFKRMRATLYKSRMIKQPYPNLIDAAVAAPVNQNYVKLQYPDGSMLSGTANLELGDLVKKMGRTTKYTSGIIEGVNTMVRVQYGAGQVATFDDQIEIRAGSGEFSAPGDSGSTILTLENKLGGLLFAGGSGVTIANRIEHVIDILGVGL